ncbi:MAG: Imidazole glycerol phosphate synthase amidotransferase subunit, partial [uncultured Acidimicrobiales bacterium]
EPASAGGGARLRDREPPLRAEGVGARGGRRPVDGRPGRDRSGGCGGAPGRGGLRPVHGGAGGDRSRRCGEGRGRCRDALPRHLRGHAAAPRVVGGVARRGRPRHPAGRRATSAGGRQAPPDAVERARAPPGEPPAGRPPRPGVDVLRPLLRPRGHGGHGGDLRLRGPAGGGLGAGQRGRHAVPPGEVGPLRPRPPGRLRGLARGAGRL